MKYSKKRERYELSNVHFNPTTIEAYSYDWWCFVKVVNGRVLFNNYSYSPSTSKHQSKVRTFMESLGIKIDYVVQAPKGLNTPTVMFEHYASLIKADIDRINKPKVYTRTKIELKQKILMTLNDYYMLVDLYSSYHDEDYRAFCINLLTEVQNELPFAIAKVNQLEIKTA